MNQAEWIKSVNATWRSNLDIVDGRDIRVELLGACEIKGDCWVATVGKTRVGRHRRPVQWVAYSVFKGPIPRKKGTRVESTCGRERCCLPDHLRLVLPVKQTVSRGKEKKTQP